jgi:hypothetical protein
MSLKAMDYLANYPVFFKEVNVQIPCWLPPIGNICWVKLVSTSLTPFKILGKTTPNVGIYVVIFLVSKNAFFVAFSIPNFRPWLVESILFYRINWSLGGEPFNLSSRLWDARFHSKFWLGH